MLNRKHKSMYCLRKGNRKVCVSEREELGYISNNLEQNGIRTYLGSEMEYTKIRNQRPGLNFCTAEGTS